MEIAMVQHRFRLDWFNSSDGAVFQLCVPKSTRRQIKQQKYCALCGINQCCQQAAGTSDSNCL